MNRDDVINHLQIMHTWATFALQNDIYFFNEAHMKSIAEWTMDAIALLEKQERIENSTQSDPEEKSESLFQKNIKRLAEEKGVTWREIAAAIYVSEVRMYRLVNGEREATPVETLNLLHFFNCKPSELLGE